MSRLLTNFGKDMSPRPPTTGQWEGILQIIEEYPDVARLPVDDRSPLKRKERPFTELREEDKKRWLLPLQFIADGRESVIQRDPPWRPPLDVVRALLQAYPRALRLRDSEGRLPLYTAASNRQCPVEITLAIFNGFKEAVRVSSIKGLGDPLLHKAVPSGLPLHQALLSRIPIEATLAILDADKNTARVKQQDGWLPLHAAVVQDWIYASGDKFSSADRHSIVLSLLDAFPAAAQVPDARGYLPLHHAARSGCALETVLAILEAYEEGASAQDDDTEPVLGGPLFERRKCGGRLPLHFAAANSSTDVVQPPRRPQGGRNSEGLSSTAPFAPCGQTTKPTPGRGHSGPPRCA